MKIDTIKNSLENINLLRFLKSDLFITSSKIKENFPQVKNRTLHQWLEDFSEEGIILKKDRDYGLAEDKVEYKLSEKGLNILDDLLRGFSDLLK